MFILKLETYLSPENYAVSQRFHFRYFVGVGVFQLRPGDKIPAELISIRSHFPKPWSRLPRSFCLAQLVGVALGIDIHVKDKIISNKNNVWKSYRRISKVNENG